MTKRGTKSLVLQYKYRKRRRKMGLGPLRLVDLDTARRKRNDAHNLLLDGVDPLALRAKRRAKAATAKTRNRPSTPRCSVAKTKSLSSPYSA